MTSLLLALDFGGTKHAAAATTLGSAQWLAYRRAVSPPDANQETDLHIMRSLIHDVLGDKRPDAMGVSFGGPVDFTTGTVRLSHHVPGWENVPLQAWLEDEIGVPVSVDNDANVAALGESRFGAGQPYDSLLYVTVSTGVGGGWILNKQPWRGNRSMAGEIGHTVVDPTGPVCLCGKRGCVERLASGPYLAHDAIAHLQEHPKQGAILRELVDHHLPTITAQHISEAANRGDEVAHMLIERAGWAIGVGIGNAANLIAPQGVVLGGGVTKAGEHLWQMIRETAHNTALPEIAFDIIPAALGDDAPLWGAIALAENLV
ncbi:MAG: ROK family protein [Elainellaceae cyanobacterium]